MRASLSFVTEVLAPILFCPFRICIRFALCIVGGISICWARMSRSSCRLVSVDVGCGSFIGSFGGSLNV